MIGADFMVVAEALVDLPAKGSIKQAYRRRAVSTAYYALFHALAALCANELVGKGQSRSAAWKRVYRALEHGFAKNALLDLARRSKDPDVKVISEAFVSLQQFRHDADYDPHQPHLAGSDGAAVAVARLGMMAVHQLSPEMRMELVTTLLLRSRP